VTLREKILREIQERGPMLFSRYMELCLYDPELGYYSRDSEQFGKAGDFYTSSDVHALFGRLLARQFEEMWRILGSPPRIDILELGPGRGLFARDVLDWSEKKLPQFFSALHYSLIEQSPTLRKRLQRTLNNRFPDGTVSVAAELTNLALPAIVFANEFFDALPVEVMSPEGALRIAERDRRFIETWTAATPEQLEFCDRFGVHPVEEERVEVPLRAQDYMSRLSASMDRGFVIVIDYGYTRQEQLAGRHRGTIVATRQHSVSSNPYEAPGEQDITAHVNFTALAAAAEQQGMQAQPLITQSQFLLGIGEQNQFGDVFEECRLPQERAKVALQLKHLVSPAGMGETFHVLVASKGVEPELVAGLSGLSFGRTLRRGNGEIPSEHSRS
jgi:SAM-dependent MidA family methyltransferase